VATPAAAVAAGIVGGHGGLSGLGRVIGNSLAVSQTGHPHTSAGKSGAYSATGGDKWEELRTKAGGPQFLPAGMDSMFLDLSGPGQVDRIIGKALEAPSFVGGSGEAPGRHSTEIKIPNLTAWKYMSSATMSIRNWDAGGMSAIDQELRNAQDNLGNYNMSTLKRVCHDYLHRHGHNATRERAVQALYDVLVGAGVP
jgi:hypothetical protein